MEDGTQGSVHTRPALGQRNHILAPMTKTVEEALPRTQKQEEEGMFGLYMLQFQRGSVIRKAELRLREGKLIIP